MEGIGKGAAAVVAAAVLVSVVTTAGTAAPPPSTAFSVGHTVLLAERQLTSGCKRRVRPDQRCSPGAISSGLTTRVLCSDSFRTGTIRNVTTAVKFALERSYGMAARGYGRTIEIDHIVSLELGGSNDIANLFPQSGAGRASYHAKDKLENRLHSMVCAGGISLRAAQRGIATDWVALYERVFGSRP